MTFKGEDVFFADPKFFWLLTLIIPCLIWYYLTNNKSNPTLIVSSIHTFNGSSQVWGKLRHSLIFLRLISIIFLIIAIARPQTVDVSSQKKMNKGIDIIMAIDVSSSMLAQDLKPNRLIALKKVASNFIRNRINDRIGIVVYAGESYTKTPITSDKSIIQNSLSKISYDGVIEDGTAIGMGLATSVNRLKDSKAKSKVIILLTDGVNNSGFIDPKTAADLASSFGIKTYTIGLGSNGNALAPIAINPNGTFRYGLTKVEIDEELLKSIANETGGLYFRATDNERLKNIYEEINKLEKTEVEEFKYSNAEEMYRRFVLISFLLVFLEWALRSTIFKRFL
jgi:Ca-activated chloride channel family protein